MDELLFHMPTIAKSANAEWERRLSLSMMQQSPRRGWCPSDKQAAMMHKLVSALFIKVRGDDEEFHLIDDYPQTAA
ncbi:hypothetical protein [Pseudorhodobacter wandonensis]|uniref:hypothetical protein n=1 Tax=Pseudorhodobacter wandonensis TaxID=1120568 RepID=UPI0018CD9F52|nr:hypothetical protein [Pseudorhodobacter wandonensis]